MARQKSPCGTYPAYQRHLREKTPVDAACRRAQKKHDAGVSLIRRTSDVEAPLVAAAPPSKLDTLRQHEGEVRTAFVAKIAELTEHVEEDWLYGVIDTTGEMDDLLEEWCNVRDDIDYELGYPDLSPELRATLIAAHEPDDTGDEPEPPEN